MFDLSSFRGDQRGPEPLRQSVAIVGHVPKAAKAAGATDAQIKEAIATAALVRFNSTMLQGSGYDLQKFQQEVDRLSAPKP